MKVLLINPHSRLVESNKKKRKIFLTPIIPLGIAYISAVLEKNGIDVTVIDQVASGETKEALLAQIKAQNPDIVGFSCLTASMGNVKILCSEIRKYNTNIKIVLGNLHASIFADILLKEGIGDIIVHGEGEYTMLDIVNYIANRRSLFDIKGISFRNNGNVHHNAEREPIDDLDNLPYPAVNLLNLAYYMNVPLVSIYGARTMAINGSRGCPYRCVFCSQDRMHKRPRYRKIKSIIDEMEFMSKRYSIKYFGFNDAFFPYSKASGLEFCDEFIFRGLHKNIRWVTESRVDLADFELLKRMKEAGAHLIMYGFEVGNQKILDNFKKGVTLQQAKIAMKHTKRAGLMTMGLFMLGLPGESKETCKETIKFAKELDCDFVKFNICVPYPGTDLFDSCKDDIKEIDDLEKFNSWYDWFSDSGKLVYVPKGMTSEELKNLQREAMFSFYARPRIILKNIIKRRISLKFFFYGIRILIDGYIKIIRSKIERRK